MESVFVGDGVGLGDFIGATVGAADLVAIGRSGVFSGGIEFDGIGDGEGEGEGDSELGGEGSGSGPKPPPPPPPTKPPVFPVFDVFPELDGVVTMGAGGATVGADDGAEFPLPPPALNVVISSEASEVDPVELTAVSA